MANELTKAIAGFREGREPRRDVISGWLVDWDGLGNSHVDGEAGYQWVLVDKGQGVESGDVIKCWARTRPVPGWPVRVGTTRERPWEYSVLAVDDEAMGGAIDGLSDLQHHSTTHDWADPTGSDDVTYPRWLQLFDFSVWPVDGMTVQVMPGVYDPSGVKVDFAHTYVDLSDWQPSGTTGERWLLVCLTPSGTIQLFPGPISASFLDVDDIPDAPADEWWELAAVKLKAGATDIRQIPGDEFIVDLRMSKIGYPQSEPSGTVGKVAWENVLIVAKAGGDYDTIQEAADAATARQVIYVHPGWWDERVTFASEDLIVQGWSHERIGAFGSHIRVVGDTSPMVQVNHTTNIHNMLVNGTVFSGPGSGDFIGINAPSTNYNLQLIESRVHINVDLPSGRNPVGVALSGRAADVKESSIVQCVIKADDEEVPNVYYDAVHLYGENVVIENSEIWGDILDKAGTNTTLWLRNCYVNGDVTGDTGSTLKIDNNTYITGTVSGWATIEGPIQKGSPARPYQDTKANIQAAFTDEGQLAYATDTDELGFYDGASWQWSDFSVGGLNWENVIIVAKSGGDYTTIGAAITAAAAGDTIFIMPGTYSELVTIDEDITLKGLSRDDCIITADLSAAAGVPLLVTSSPPTQATIENLTVYHDAAVAAAVSGVTGIAATVLTHVHNVSIYVDAQAGNFGSGTLCITGTLNLHNCDIRGYGGTAGYAIQNQTPGATNAYYCSLFSDTYDFLVTSGTVTAYFCQYTTLSGSLVEGDATAILNSLLTVDGAGSGLDADTLDTYHAALPGEASKIPVYDASGNLILPDSGLVILNGASDDWVWKLGETALDLDFTGTTYDTVAECNAVGIRFSDSDTPYPSSVQGVTTTGSWSHTAGRGWRPASAVDLEGPGMLVPLMRPGNFIFEVVLDYYPSAVAELMQMKIGPITNDHHVGVAAILADAWAGETKMRVYLQTNDGDDTYTSQHTGTEVSGADVWTLRIKIVNGCYSVWDQQDSAWHDYEGLPAVGYAYTGSNLFIQMYKYTSRVICRCAVASLKVTYLL